VLDTDEDDAVTVENTKRVRRVNQGQERRTETRKEKETETKTTKIWCWDCGKDGHVRSKCPEHYKFKPKDWVNKPRPQQNKSSGKSYPAKNTTPKSDSENGNGSQ
jgi:hypothetical protein